MGNAGKSREMMPSCAGNDSNSSGRDVAAGFESVSGSVAGSTAGFPRSARLVRPADFKRVFSSPVVSADRHFKVLACVGTSDRSRLGMAVSRQVDRRAAVRNRIKRIIRESFRQSMAGPAVAGTSPIDCVVLPRKECASICNRQLFRSLERHWQRVQARLATASETAARAPAVKAS